MHGKAPLPMLGEDIRSGVWAGEGVQIAPTAELCLSVLLTTAVSWKDKGWSVSGLEQERYPFVGTLPCRS